VGGQPDVAVVEADHEEALGREPLAPLPPVGDALAPEAVDEQQGGVAGIPERLVEDGDAAVAGLGHVEPLASARRGSGSPLATEW
jgi:hypothetical protein